MSVSIIFLVVWTGWFLSEILLNRLFRSKMTDSGKTDKNSLLLIWITIVVSMTLGVLCKMYLFCPVTGSNLAGYAGLVAIVTGIMIRFIAIRTLGRFFTVDVAILKDHKLVNKGIYKYIRHPSYTGSLISFFGMGLSLNNWISLIVIFIPVLISFISRMNIEEKLLHEKLGSEYDEYLKRTKRLLPLVY
jgi:protein-S-isoprenylcysteine O-methyltransferase Ste14